MEKCLAASPYIVIVVNRDSTRMGKCLAVSPYIVIVHSNRDSTRMDKCLIASPYIAIIVIGTLQEWTNV